MVEHDWDGHGGCVNGCRTCRVAELEHSISVLAVEQIRLRAQNDQILETLKATAADWKSEAARIRYNRGQITRVKSGHEVLAACATAIEDVVLGSWRVK